MKLSSFFTSLGLLAVAAAAPTSSVSTNTIASSDVVDGAVPIDTSSTLPFQHSALQKLNSTAWEYWYFDGVSSDTKSGITIVFFRDASTIPGINLRVGIDAVWANGTRFTSIIAADNSTIQTTGDITKGRWSGASCDSSFEFQGGNSQVTISMNGTSLTGQHILGTYTLKSFTNARYPTGETYPNSAASVSLAPMIWWNEGIPGGDVIAAASLDGTPFAFTGVGGTDRNFAPYIWDYLADHWWWVRAVAGPYTLVHWKFVSSIDGKTYSYAYLEQSKAVVFKSTKECTGSKDTGCAVFTLQNNGAIKGSFNDTSTGFGIEYRSANKKWSFNVTHVNIVFESPAGLNNQYSRFVNSVAGGETGGQQYCGASKSEQNRIVTHAAIP